ncbi:manganese-dependent inorganic pyrophosphatase [archaeon]|jgi:manganese-dependent inorganic pyrophosphatase|nr:manganese-dependent inorganic pyrophosphatase [archaeon]MBT7129002.1 manganese-dependent inorganic pyrophosphatase [archaeon]
MIYVIGHKSPDSDSVCSAIAVTELKRQLGIKCEARVAGDINAESKFILEKFGMEVPEVLDNAEDEDIILVDHSDLSQGVDGLEEARVVGIVDHHKLGDVETSVPVEVLIRPLGCTCTIIKGLFDYYRKEISKDIAGIMLCAILSDSVIFKSPTCTDEDRDAVADLAKIAGVGDVEGLGMEMFRVKSDVEGTSAKDLVMGDYKDFNMGGKKVGVGQLELVDLKMLDGREDELLEEMERLKDDGRDAVFLMLTDIMREGTMLLCVSRDAGLREEVFGENEDGWYDGMMSRKKQVVPKLEEFFG